MTDERDPLLTVDPHPEWAAITGVEIGPRSRLWSISDDIREGFGETVVECLGSLPEAVLHHELIAEFHEACMSLPDWSQSAQSLWAEEKVSYALFTGTAVVGSEKIESTSVIGISTTDESLTAHQVVVTTFADSHARHRDVLDGIRTRDSTVGCIIDEE